MSTRVTSTFYSASQLHRKSEEARENDKLNESLILIDKAIEQYSKDENFEGVARALQSKVLSYKHLFLLTKEDKYRKLASEFANESLRIAQEKNLGNVLSSSYFRIAEIANLFQDYNKAEENFGKALELYTGTNAEKGDYIYHWGEAIFNSGNQEKGKETMLKGLSEIQANRNDVDPFLIHVWESGCLLRLAKAYKDAPKQSREFIKQAKKIIGSDKKLVIRKRQLREMIKETFS